MSKNQQPVFELNKREDDPASKIELIKELIFGENIQAYETEFETLKKDIQVKKKVLDDLIEEVRSELKKSIDDVSTDVNIRITELEENIENKFDHLEKSNLDKKIMGSLLIELGEKISKK